MRVGLQTQKKSRARVAAVEVVGSGWATYRVNQQETQRERDREEGEDNRNTRGGGRVEVGAGGGAEQAGVWERQGGGINGGGGNYLSGESVLPSKLKRYSVRIVQWWTEQDTVKTSQPSWGVGEVERWGIKLFSKRRKRFTLNKRHLSPATCNRHLHLLRHHRSPFLFPPFSLNPPPLPPLLPPPLWWNLKQSDPQNIPAKSQKPARTHVRACTCTGEGSEIEKLRRSRSMCDGWQAGLP